MQYSRGDEVGVASSILAGMLGQAVDAAPMVVPIRGHLDSVKRLIKGDTYTGRGKRQRGLAERRCCNPFKGAVCGRAGAMSGFGRLLLNDSALRSRLWSISGLRLLCRCLEKAHCHADVIIHSFGKAYLHAYNCSAKDQLPPSSPVLHYLARLCDEPDTNEGSTANEGAPVPTRSRGQMVRRQKRKLDMHAFMRIAACPSPPLATCPEIRSLNDRPLQKGVIPRRSMITGVAVNSNVLALDRNENQHWPWTTLASTATDEVGSEDRKQDAQDALYRRLAATTARKSGAKRTPPYPIIR